MLGIATLALLVVASACSNNTKDADTAEEVTPKDGPTITVGSADFPESFILAEIYAQGLEAKGYTTETKLNIGSRELYFPALEKGTIDLFPEYTGSLLSYLSKQKETPSPDSDETYAAAEKQLDGKNLTMLDYAPAQDKDGIVTNKQSVDKYDLSKLSDLKAHGSMLVMGGPPECKTRQACLKGLQTVYKIKFKEFKPLDAGGPQTIQALKANQIQIANLFTTDPRIAANDFVLLEDDKGPLAGAENVVPVVRDETLDAYDAELTAAVNAITETLTTEGLLALNDRVVNDKEDAEDVAADYLAEEDLA
jgi:osmoprotectant transport system substrate-binding protein